MNLLILTAFGFLAGIPILVACGGPATTGASKPAASLPDLSVRVPEGWDAPIKFDPKELQFAVAWTNQGDDFAEEYSIALLMDGYLVHEWVKPVLAPGSVRTETVALDDFPKLLTLSAGPHKMELIVDHNESVVESNEENNSYSVMREFKFELPDLKPSAPKGLGWGAPVVFGAADLVYGTGEAPVDGGYFMAYSVVNSGANAARSWGSKFQVSVDGLLVQGRFADTRGDSDPSPGQELISVFPIWKITVFEGPLLTGKHRIDLIIDKDNSVLESDEENNFLSLDVEILPSRVRSLVDQPDELESIIHLAYVLPADGADEEWDINGTIESIVASMQEWLSERANGRELRLDSTRGSLDITFVRLQRTSDQIAQSGFTPGPLTDELYSAGFNDPNKIYAVWYPFPGRAGDIEDVCGLQSNWQDVRFAFSFFERLAPRNNACMNQHTIMLHEIFHALGAVSPCAPNYLIELPESRAGHVGDDPNDLMYAGDRIGIPVELDKDHQDYFGHAAAGCPDTADSPYLEPRSGLRTR